jgi:fused signal recognition particle receptor
LPFNFFRRRKEAHDAEAAVVAEAEPELDEALDHDEPEALEVEDELVEDISDDIDEAALAEAEAELQAQLQHEEELLHKVEEKTQKALTRTKRSWFGRIGGILGRGAKIDEDTWLELEEVLLGADVGVHTTEKVLARVREQVEKQRIGDAEEVRAILKEELMAILTAVPFRGALWREDVEVPPRPGVILVVGVNGTGKTTSIAKLAHLYTSAGDQVVVAAGDTFRAAAIDQLRTWSERVGAQIVAHKEGADPGAVAFDAVGAAQNRNAAVAIIDTAGRLHTKFNLMEELRKIRRVIERRDPEAPHEVLLVLDATTGQNALIQAKAFAEAVDVTAIALTKLDGTAKGGIVFAICDELALPVRFVGTGEGEDDLSPFDAEAFVDALFDS